MRSFESEFVLEAPSSTEGLSMVLIFDYPMQPIGLFQCLAMVTIPAFSYEIPELLPGVVGETRNQKDHGLVKTLVAF